MLWRQTVLVWNSFCLCCLPSLVLFHFPFLFLWDSVTLYSVLWLFCQYALSYIYFCSSFLHLVDDSLVFESCAFCSMICSVVSMLLPGLSLFLLLLLHPGRQPTLTYVSASDVLIYNRTMLITMLNSSPTLLVTPRDPPEHPILCPNLRLSPSHFMLPPPMAGLPGTGLLYTGRDCGFTCQSPGETSRVSVHFTVFTLWFRTIMWQE